MPGRFEEIEAALECGKNRCDCQKRNASHLTHCPSHAPDNNPSLSITRQPDGGILLSCKANKCEQHEIIAALTELGLWTAKEQREPADFQSARRARPKKPERAQGKRKASAKEVDTNRDPDQVWYFTDENGFKWAKKARWNGPGGSKTFRLQAHDQRRWGLGDLELEDIPLYGTELLAEAEDPLYFVEGEKCADRVRDEGPLALCAPGGSDQHKFGTSLFPLAGRTVYTLADNDPEGDEFMSRVEQELRRLGCDVTRLHLPVLPREDVYDYLEAGHTLRELMDQQFLDPFIEPITDGLRVHVPADQPGTRHVFQFEHLQQRRGEINATLQVWVAGPLAPPHVHGQRINSESGSATDGLVRRLRGIFNTKDHKHPFDRTVSVATDYVRQYVTAREFAVDAATMAEPGPIAWCVASLLQRGQPHVLFGDGEAGKSLTALGIAASVAYGLPVFGEFYAVPGPVLYVDFETDGDGGEDWRRRLGRVVAGLDEDLEDQRVFYWPGGGTPLAEQTEALRKFVKRQGIALLVIDSVVPALGGSPLETGPVQDFFQALTRIGTTSLLIAHISQEDAKGGRQKQTPYGNRFWHNLPRATYRLDVRKETVNDDLRALMLAPTKANNWPKTGSIFIDQAFDGQLGPITFRRSMAWKRTAEAQDRHRTWTDRVMEALQSKPGMTVPELVVLLDGSDDTIRKTLGRAESKGTVARQTTVDGPDQWFVA